MNLRGPSEEVREACGVFGIYTPGMDVARLTFFGLYALQHRGQESAGIASSDGKAAYTYRGMGLVAQVFHEDNLRPLKGHLAIGHNRYSTTGSSHVRNAQPYLIETIDGPLGIAHNGNLTNALELRQMLLERGVGLYTTTDSEIIVQMLAAPPEVWTGDHGPSNGHHEDDPWIHRIRAFMKLAHGAYSLTILTRDAIYAVRDPLGLRPLCLGELDGGHVVASESCALLTIGARYLREVRPGEIIRLDRQGITSIVGHTSRRNALCVFEYVYFARPDSWLEDQVVHTVRQRLGQQLAREAPADADIVVGVPDSAIPAAIGYSRESGFPYTEGLTKNRYIGRTFIQPNDHLRQLGVNLKYNPLTANLQGQRVVMVDDSIVRGNTAGPLVQLLRDGGAAEVHMRVSSPPVRHPCFMGVDMATHNELIAHNMDVEQIRQKIGADSLHYLSHEGMLQAVREGIKDERRGHCSACFSGDYPLTIPEWLFRDDREKLIFEASWGS
ncbi:MAG: amidophosphoribosyltransferase [Chloroflexaceae bacterium]|nr:amidophosphoribosyltransferase [Chloroflexaceae bacterium]